MCMCIDTYICVYVYICDTYDSYDICISSSSAYGFGDQRLKSRAGIGLPEAWALTDKR